MLAATSLTEEAREIFQELVAQSLERVALADFDDEGLEFIAGAGGVAVGIVLAFGRDFG